LQRGALCRDEVEEGTGDRDDALVRALHGHPLVCRNAVAEKVVALVRVARANVEERGERVGAPRCETGAKWRLADARPWAIRPQGDGLTQGGQSRR